MWCRALQVCGAWRGAGPLVPPPGPRGGGLGSHIRLVSQTLQWAPNPEPVHPSIAWAPMPLRLSPCTIASRSHQFPRDAVLWA